MAISLKGIGGSAAKWASGVNWQLLLFKFTAAAAILIISLTMAYREGKADCKLEKAEQTITLITQQQAKEREFIREQLKVQTVEIQSRLKVINTQSREAQELRSELRVIGGKLNEAINARPANPACAPSDGELRQYEEIAKRTRPSR